MNLFLPTANVEIMYERERKRTNINAHIIQQIHERLIRVISHLAETVCN